jgi:hypothetical protein
VVSAVHTSAVTEIFPGASFPAIRHVDDSIESATYIERFLDLSHELDVRIVEIDDNIMRGR